MLAGSVMGLATAHSIHEMDILIARGVEAANDAAKRLQVTQSGGSGGPHLIDCLEAVQGVRL